MLTAERKAERKSRCGGCAEDRNVYLTLAAVTSRTKDGDGGYTDNYTALSPANDWAGVDSATPTDIERVMGGTVTAHVSHLVKMRFHSGVNTNTRITFTDKAGTTHTLYVRGIRNVGQRDVELELGCEEAISVAVVPT